jgi:hypothetical protein
MSLEKYSGQLRTLNEDYYCGHLSFEEYRMLRGEILSAIENDMNMISNTASDSNYNMLDRLLSYFKSTETNG